VATKITNLTQWGAIQGTLSNQTDLQTAFNDKQPKFKFVYNSAGSQDDVIRFNDWSDLMTAIGSIDGTWSVQFEQIEDIPAGTYDVSFGTFFGNGVSAVNGGIYITCGTNVFFTSSTSFRVDEGLGVLASGSTSPFKSSNIFQLVFANGAVAAGAATTCIDNEAGGFMILGFSAGQTANFGYEALSTASTSETFIVLQAGSSTIRENTIRGTGLVERIFFAIGIEASDAQANYSGTMNTTNFNLAQYLKYINTTSGLTATNAQAAIDELARERTEDIITATTTVSNTTTETTLYTGSIGANTLVAGDFIKVFTSGVITNATASDDITINVYIGTSLVATYAPAIGNVTGADWHTETELTVRSIGATGSVAVHGEVNLNGNIQFDNSIETIDTTVAEDITVKVQWANAKAGNTISIYQGHVEFKD